MTYCAGLLLNDGVVLASDTRTNAGLDNIATFLQDAHLGAAGGPGDRAAFGGQSGREPGRGGAAR